MYSSGRELRKTSQQFRIFGLDRRSAMGALSGVLQMFVIQPYIASRG